MKKLLNEPLLQFLALGALIFAAYAWFSREVPSGDEIVVTQGQQEHLLNMFTRTWQRPPTPQEFDGLLRDHIREEIAYREGLAMGFDEGDTIIRRRMRQKLELLTEEIVGLDEPSDAELQQYLRNNPEKFRIEPTLDLRQIYVSRERRGAAAEADVRSILQRLNNDPDAEWTAMGDPFPLGDEFTGVGVSELERQFGAGFVQGMLQQEQGRWAGPVESAYGIHLVFISNLTPTREPALAEVRERVQSQWLAEQRRVATDRLYQRMAGKYSIEIEPFSADGES